MIASSIKRVIVILADGVRYDVLSDLISKGDLPAFNNLFVNNGVLLKASTVFPSTTGPAYLPFLTGSFPSSCHVPGIRWLDKGYFGSGKNFLKQHRSYVGLESFLLNSDISKDVRTIFELVPDSYSIFSPISRGTGRRNLTSIMRIWYWYYSHLTDFWDAADSASLDKMLSALDIEGLKFLFVVFPGVDEFSHLSSPESKYTIESYKWLDHSLSELRSRLQNKSMLEDTAIFLVSDHGLSKTDHHFCVNTFLKERGIDTFFYPTVFDRKGKIAANMVSGNGMTHLYFKNGDSWSNRMTRTKLERNLPSLISDLLKEDAIDIVACNNDDGSVEMLSKRGAAKGWIEGGEIHYRVEGNDPFGFPKMGERLSIKEELDLSIDTDYPDAILQLIKIMQEPRSGDVLLSAKPGFDLRLKYESPEHKSSHGSLHRDHMLVPICSNIRLKKGIRTARTVDLFPTILDLLDVPTPHNIEGISLI